jgi:uncharacterized integral membrane protein
MTEISRVEAQAYVDAEASVGRAIIDFITAQLKGALITNAAQTRRIAELETELVSARDALKAAETSNSNQGRT